MFTQKVRLKSRKISFSDRNCVSMRMKPFFIFCPLFLFESKLYLAQSFNFLFLFKSQEEHVTHSQAAVTDSILEPIKTTTIQKASIVVNESASITGTATTKKLETTTVLSTTSVSTTTTEPYTGPPTLGRNKRSEKI